MLTIEQKKQLVSIKSTTGIVECECLYDLVQTLEPNDIIVELGTGLGRTACAMGLACVGTSRKLYTIDTYQESHRYAKCVNSNWDRQTALDNIQRLNLESYVIQIEGESHNLPESIPEQIGMIFIDASHTYEKVKQDIITWKPRIKPQGWMTGHDWLVTNSDGRNVIKAVVETVMSPFHDFKLIEGVWMIKRYW